MYHPLKSFEGIYEISTNGKIRNKEKVNMKFFESNDKYLRVTLVKNGKQSNYYVHRLVCIQFINRVAGKTQVNHKDLDRQNNKVNNLEWCTPEYNSNHRGNSNI